MSTREELLEAVIMAVISDPEVHLLFWTGQASYEMLVWWVNSRMEEATAGLVFGSALVSGGIFGAEGDEGEDGVYEDDGLEDGWWVEEGEGEADEEEVDEEEEEEDEADEADEGEEEEEE